MMNDSKEFKGRIDWVTTLVPFGIVLALAYIIKKRNWLSHLLIVLMFMSFSPYLSSVFLV